MATKFKIKKGDWYSDKPIRNGLFLEQYGPYSLVYVYGAVPIALTLFVPLYTRAVARVGSRLLTVVTLLFFATNVLLFWYAFRYHPFRLLPGVFFVWVNCFGIIAPVQAWSFANSIFDTRQAKRDEREAPAEILAPAQLLMDIADADTAEEADNRLVGQPRNRPAEGVGQRAAVTVHVGAYSQPRHDRVPRTVVGRKRLVVASACAQARIGSVAKVRRDRLQEQHVHRPAIGAVRVIASGPDGQVGHAVAVQITQRRQGPAKVVTVDERGAAIRATGQLQAALHRAAGVQQQHMHGPAI